MKSAYAAATAIVFLATLFVMLELSRQDDSDYRDVRIAQPGQAVVAMATADNGGNVITPVAGQPDAILAQTSLADTSVPGTIETDALGNLIITGDSKAVMDYFLSLSGELSPARIRETMLAWARGIADNAAAQQFITLFDQYQNYIQAVASGEFTAGDDNLIRANLERRQQLRDAVFGQATAASFFIEEDNYDQFSAARLDILKSSLDDAQKTEAMRDLYLTLPAAIARQYEQQHQLEQLQQQELSLRENGADDAAIYAHRQQQFGDMAAVRLQALDDQRQQWQQRVDQYRDARQLIAAAALSDADRQRQIDTLRQDLFSEAEQRRIEALDRMALPAD